MYDITNLAYFFKASNQKIKGKIFSMRKITKLNEALQMIFEKLKILNLNTCFKYGL
jgi:hypothetical protein